MRAARRLTKTFRVIGSAVLVIGATAPVVASAIAPAPATAAPAPGTPAPLAPTQARAQAKVAYQKSASTPGTQVPLVTVEMTPSGDPLIATHRVTSEAEANSVATAAAKRNDLISVQPDQVVRPLGGTTRDTYSSSQWALDPLKTTFANAWKTTTGKGIVVAVIDTGVDSKHPDLNGQVLPGRQFLNGSAAGVAMAVATDTCGHGTHVSGIIAALANNNLGIAGAASGVKILPVKVLNCSGYTSDVANGIKWAANNGARVINLSLGGTAQDSALDAAIAYARTKQVVVVAAAGNNGTGCTNGKNATSYPGASAGVIGVGSIDSNFNRSCFSSTGSYVDLVGPGSGILSTYPTAMTTPGYAPYVSMSGTSMATPHVAAAAALVLSRKATCTPDQVEVKLESTARRLGGTARNNDFGFGLIDPARAVATFAC